MNLRDYLPTIRKFIKHEYKYKFTVFIPVYNGEKTIIRALKGIEAQTFKDFEVLIINDGSTDATSEIIENYLNESTLQIRFIDNNENIHKLGIIYQGVFLAQGEFFLIHDADDSSVPDALKIYAEAYNCIPDKLKPKISGITAHCIDQYGNFIGTKLKSDPLYCNAFEFSFYHKIVGEKWGPTKTDILKQIVINKSIFNHGLIPESYLWLTIAKEGYQTKYINEVTRIYFVDNENNLSSLNYKNKAFGMTIYSILFLNFFYREHLYKLPIAFFKRLISILLASNYLDYDSKTYYNSIDSKLLKIIFMILWPFRKITKYSE